MSATFRIIKRGKPIRSFNTHASAGGVAEQLWRGRQDDGSRVQPGRYRVVVIGQDAAGNRARTSVRLRVTR